MICRVPRSKARRDLICYQAAEVRIALALLAFLLDSRITGNIGVPAAKIVGVSRSAKSYKSRLFGSPQNSKNFPRKASWLNAAEGFFSGITRSVSGAASLNPLPTWKSAIAARSPFAPLGIVMGAAPARALETFTPGLLLAQLQLSGLVDKPLLTNFNNLLNRA
jgi:hypothetical protein